MSHPCHSAERPRRHCQVSEPGSNGGRCQPPLRRRDFRPLPVGPAESRPGCRPPRRRSSVRRRSLLLDREPLRRRHFRGPGLRHERRPPCRRRLPPLDQELLRRLRQGQVGLAGRRHCPVVRASSRGDGRRLLPGREPLRRRRFRVQG
ncbi:hypothetical protein ACFXPS_02280 [Nocardia sp. NPDC059091]|uniref:hypothetical protein n=1 Tax=unclassified Nocardia TaxID=2637762 RepID=UPI0036AFEC09